MQARVRFGPVRRNPLRRSCASSAGNAGESAFLIGRAPLLEEVSYTTLVLAALPPSPVAAAAQRLPPPAAPPQQERICPAGAAKVRVRGPCSRRDCWRGPNAARPPVEAPAEEAPLQAAWARLVVARAALPLLALAAVAVAALPLLALALAASTPEVAEC